MGLRMIKCRKVCYATKQAAKFVVKRFKANGDKRKLRIYLCDDCDCWHTSKYSADDVKRMKDRVAVNRE